MPSPSWSSRYWTVLLWRWTLSSLLKYQEWLNKWHSHMAEDVGRQMYLSCTVFLLSEFGYLLLEQQHLLFVVWLDMSEMLHFYACSEMFRKLFHKFGYQLKLLQYYRWVTQTIFFLPTERLQWQSKETSLFYPSYFSVTQFSVFQRSISSWSGAWLGGKGW